MTRSFSVVHAPSRRVLWLEAAGFGLIALAIWLDELLDLPHLMFHAPISPFRPEEAGAESALVIAVGAAVVWWSHRQLAKAAYLESLIMVCAWCHRVKLDTVWVSLELFLREHRAETTHGICPVCALELMTQVDDAPAPTTPPA